MIIGDRLRALRAEKNLKWTRALEVPLYQIFYSGEALPEPLKRTKTNSRLWDSKGKEARLLTQLRRTLSLAQESDRQLLLHMA